VSDGNVGWDQSGHEDTIAWLAFSPDSAHVQLGALTAPAGVETESGRELFSLRLPVPATVMPPF
jgi:hypothetical protein